VKRFLLMMSVVALAFAVTAMGSVGNSKLSGVTGPSFKITLTSGSGAVKTLKSGTYTIVVNDKSSIHNFHLFGPAVNKKTTVPFTGTQSWTVKLKSGTYTYQCDVHATTGMKGTFKVTS